MRFKDIMSGAGVVLLLLLFVPVAGYSTEVVEPGSGHHFSTSQSYQGKNYILVGVGMRKNGAAKTYAMALYVEDAAKQSFPSLRAKTGNSKAMMLAESRAQNFFTWGHFAKLSVQSFLRAIDKDELRATYREGLSEALSDKAPPDLRKDAEAFLKLFDQDLKEGQEVWIATDDTGKISVELADQSKPGPQNPKLCRAIWETWLGYRAVSKEMRQSLVGHIDAIGKSPK